MKIKLSIFFLILISIFSCTEGTIISDYDIIFPDENVSYLYHVQPFLKANCAFAGCHGVTAAGGIDMSEYFPMMSVPGLVIPLKPEASQLNQILEEIQPHQTLFYRGNITDNQIIGMNTWVREGAINN